MSSGNYPVDRILADFLESNVAMLVATSDTENKPTITRGFGARVSEDREHVTVFVTLEQSASTLRDVEKTGRIAVNAARISDYESYQLKGNHAQLIELSDQDSRHVAQYIKGVQSELGNIGLTPLQQKNTFRSYSSQTLVGIIFTLQEVYCQTPGPGAGKPREPHS